MTGFGAAVALLNSVAAARRLHKLRIESKGGFGACAQMPRVHPKAELNFFPPPTAARPGRPCLHRVRRQ